LQPEQRPRLALASVTHWNRVFERFAGVVAMNDAERVRDAFEGEWQRLDEEGSRRRLPNHALLELQKQYATLASTNRQFLEPLLADWVLSDSNRKQFDAEGLIRHFHIVSALPALRTAFESLARATDAPSVGRREMLQRLIGSLESP
jgi:hypothetical protein